MANPNLELLLGMARAMGPLCEQVVFVGGCATGLLVDDTGLMDVRPTEDVTPSWRWRLWAPTTVWQSS